MAVKPSISEHFHFFNKCHKNVSARPLGQTLTELFVMRGSAQAGDLQAEEVDELAEEDEREQHRHDELRSEEHTSELQSP